MDNNDNVELVEQEEDLRRFLGRKAQSRECDLNRKLSTIHETNQSIELEDESSTGIQKAPNAKPIIRDENDMEFELEEKDVLLEKVEAIALALDSHRIGVLYLKEMDKMMRRIPEHQRAAVQDFLAAYVKKTGKKTMSVSSFIMNLCKAVTLGKFGLQKLFSDASPVAVSALEEETPVGKPAKTHSEIHSDEDFYSQWSTCASTKKSSVDTSPTELSISISAFPPAPQLARRNLNPLSSPVPNTLSSTLPKRGLKSALSVFTPEMQKRMLSPRNMKSFHADDNYNKHQKNQQKINLKTDSGCGGGSPCAVCKSATSGDAELAQCTFKPCTFTHGMYRNVSSKIGLRTTKAPTDHSESTFAIMYEKIRRCQMGKQRLNSSFLKNNDRTGVSQLGKSYREKYGSSAPTSPRLVTIKIDASFVGKCSETELKSKGESPKICSSKKQQRSHAKMQTPKSGQWNSRRSSLSLW